MQNRWLGFLLIAIAACSTGQLVSGIESDETAAVSTRICFSALNREEKPVLGLTAKDFELRIDGKIAPMIGFHPGLPHTDRSIPVVAWIFIDFNPNLKDSVIRNQAGAAASAFNLLHPDSMLGVKMVSDRSETLAPLAHDPAALRTAFAQYGERRAELRVGSREDSVVVGGAGIARALEYALEEMDRCITSQASLRDREVHRAIIILSDGNLNPYYNLKALYAKAARTGVFLYPVYYPRGQYGPWVKDYFKLAEKSGGVASVFGALQPGSEILPMPRAALGPNALNANFIHMIRDLNGKYSFEVSPSPGRREAKLKLKCKAQGVKIRLPRTIVP